VQVLDDSTDETTEIAGKIVNQYKNQGVNITHIHRKNRNGFKAGALEQGLKIAKGEFIAIFDADFIVPKDFLKKTIDFFTDKKIGMVQTCWDYINRDYSVLTKIQALILDAHFNIEHFARNRTGKFFNFNGTAGIWRKETIVDAGGWQYDTLTEDLDLSYRAQIKGWKFIYLENVKSLSELPVDINSFKKQQYRWTKGSVETFLKIYPEIFKSNLPLKIKIESFFHLAGNFSYPLVLFLSLIMYPAIKARLEIGWYQLLFTDIPIFGISFLSIFTFYITAMKLNKEKLINSVWKIPLLMATGIGMSINNSKAVVEALLNIKSPFERTPKFNIRSKKDNWFKKTYKVKVIFTPFIELIMGCYYLFIINFAINRETFASMPFLILFFTGFIYVGLLSVNHGVKKRS
jgi:cellulose synthase/poly-beta-1,6-N-acetylglucosamine synthase-like glycosyltransferase